MSKIDSMKKSAGDGDGDEGDTFEAVEGLVKKSGGLDEMLQKFNDKGLQHKVKSWVGNDKNEEVSGDEFESAVGSDEIDEIADKMGVDKEQAKSKLAHMFPKVVDKLTPAGEVPEKGTFDKAMSALKGFFSK